MTRAAILLWVILITLTVGCKERFNPTLAPTQSNFLVVEGIINVKGFTTITLRRTVPLTDTAKLKAETNAQVTIVGDDNSTYIVKEKGSGTYVSDSLILRTTQKYRLHIKTKSGGEYFSESVAASLTPAIDSISYKVLNDGVQIYANTHDQKNNTRYYKWEYQETWEIHSAYQSSYVYKNGLVLPRDYSEILKVYYCWKNQSSSSILLASSAQLATDVISLAPLTLIPTTSEKLGVRYSILVKQSSMDAKSYQFFKTMKSNTETLGSIFDPLPSEITGNITSVTNPSEKVIGVVTASTVEEKRIFITAAEASSRYSNDCEITLVKNNPDSIKFFFGNGGLLPFEGEGAPGPITGYFSSGAPCVDCTLRGSNVKPSFW